MLNLSFLPGIGLILAELENVGQLDDTLIIYSSDNGIPFPNGRTNLFDSGMSEPMLLSSPLDTKRHGQVGLIYNLHSLSSFGKCIPFNVRLVPMMVD